MCTPLSYSLYEIKLNDFYFFLQIKTKGKFLYANPSAYIFLIIMIVKVSLLWVLWIIIVFPFLVWGVCCRDLGIVTQNISPTTYVRMMATKE